MVFILYKL